jgi:hypothetical protein
MRGFHDVNLRNHSESLSTNIENRIAANCSLSMNQEEVLLAIKQLRFVNEVFSNFILYWKLMWIFQVCEKVSDFVMTSGTPRYSFHQDR